MINTRDKAIGALVGLAIGDAVGTTLEFTDRDTLPPVTDMVGGGPFRLAPGEWTDDTSMALCLGFSLVVKRQFDPADFMDRCVAWWKKGEYSHNDRCFDIGITVRNSLKRYQATGQPYPQAPNSDPFSAGNGSVMRLAPVALAGWRNEPQAITDALDQSRTTHDHPECLRDCQKLASILVRLINGAAIGDCLPVDHLRTIPRHEIKSSGYVVDTMLAAQWAVANTNNFRDAILLAVCLGEDSDSVGAVTGQIAGALYGFDSIPKDWVQKLAWNDLIIRLANDLYEISP
jgi:ADP-ribosyl-[dinitrogen reductase] hydrolase